MVESPVPWHMPKSGPTHPPSQDQESWGGQTAFCGGGGKIYCLPPHGFEWGGIAPPAPPPAMAPLQHCVAARTNCHMIFSLENFYVNAVVKVL